MKRYSRFLPALLLALVLATQLAFSARAAAAPVAASLSAAPAYAIAWSVLGGGGGELTGGVFKLEGTVGQTAAGLSAPGAKQICSGFWCTVWSLYRTMLPVVIR